MYDILGSCQFHVSSYFFVDLQCKGYLRLKKIELRFFTTLVVPGGGGFIAPMMYKGDSLLYSQNNNRKAWYLNGLEFRKISGINSDMWPFYDVNSNWPT